MKRKKENLYHTKTYLVGYHTKSQTNSREQGTQQNSFNAMHSNRQQGRLQTQKRMASKGSFENNQNVKGEFANLGSNQATTNGQVNGRDAVRTAKRRSVRKVVSGSFLPTSLNTTY